MRKDGGEEGVAGGRWFPAVRSGDALSEANVRDFRRRQEASFRPVLGTALLTAAGIVLFFWIGDWMIVEGRPPGASLAVRASAAAAFLVFAGLVRLDRMEPHLPALIVLATLVAALTIALLDVILPDRGLLLVATPPLVSIGHLAVTPYFRAYPAPALTLVTVLNAYLLLRPSGTPSDALLVNTYLLPPVLLAGVLSHLMGRRRERMYAMELQLARMASTDPLTGVANRRTLEERLGREEARRTRRDFPISLLLLDLDRFKRVNDLHGHQVGDLVLREVAKRCQRVLREIDLLARIGGEEFVVLLPEADQNQALAAAERLRECLAGAPILAADASIPVTMSIGSTEVRRGESLDRAFARADAALYRAKESGRDRIEVG